MIKKESIFIKSLNKSSSFILTVFGISFFRNEIKKVAIFPYTVPAIATSFLLMEDGSFLLMEDGSKIIL